MLSDILADQTLKDIYQDMAVLTKTQCEIDCFKFRGNIGSCCCEMYCDLAIKYALAQGTHLKPTDNSKLPLMGPDGCVAPPWTRIMCTLHVCDKSLFQSDTKFSKAYFALREQIENYEYKLYREKNNS